MVEEVKYWMFEVKCAECKKVTNVSFKPSQAKPVFCKGCLSKRRPRSIRVTQPKRFDFGNAWARRRGKFPKREKKTKRLSER